MRSSSFFPCKNSIQEIQRMIAIYSFFPFILFLTLVQSEYVNITSCLSKEWTNSGWSDAAEPLQAISDKIHGTFCQSCCVDNYLQDQTQVYPLLKCMLRCPMSDHTLGWTKEPSPFGFPISDCIQRFNSPRSKLKEADPSNNAQLFCKCMQTALDRKELDICEKIPLDILPSKAITFVNKSPKDPIMSFMGNRTLKAELGRSSWRVLHLILAKFPEEPTLEESNTLSDFIYSFARLYPCGDCALHFQKILAENPPILTSRNKVVKWGCDVHNLVNTRLNKPIFNCSTIFETWNCGCPHRAKIILPE